MSDLRCACVCDWQLKSLNYCNLLGQYNLAFQIYFTYLLKMCAIGLVTPPLTNVGAVQYTEL